MRILGLDYGSRRIGVAVCDELGMTAQGVATLIRKNREADMAAIAEWIERYGIERIVVGYPIRLDGDEGIQCEKVNRFIRRLQTRFALPVIRRDETFSTKEAEELLRKTGVRRKKKRGIVDRLAAGIILQGYLDALAREVKTGQTAR
ncbi:MAG: Holliday junction resolvase RuvX [Deltaproteobacteria bacterium]|nr:Holliday junction resolvase RuvX [Deltaproteobacteria bacterium]